MTDLSNKIINFNLQGEKDMLNQTSVVTNYANGTTISLEATSALSFIESIAISSISMCREMICSTRFGVIECETRIPHYDSLIEKYCDGVHTAVLHNMLEQNIQVLYRFVEDVVSNKSVEGLYLFRDRYNKGMPAWKLITTALNEYMNLLEKEGNMLGECSTTKITNYSQYNAEFTELMENRFG